MTNETWGELRQALIGRVGRSNYTNWIEPLEFSALQDGVATFLVPTQFMGTWVERNFGDQILTVMADGGQSVERVTFKVPRLAGRPAAVDAAAVPPGSATPASPPASAVPNPASAGPSTVPAPMRDGDGPGGVLVEGNTFDAFVVGKPNELAHAAARRVAAGGPVTFNPLFLYGGVGLGKTHLMHAIAWELKAKNPDLRVLYLSAEQFMYRFIQALRDKEMIGFKQMFRSVDVLMVDDIQFLAGKDSTQEEFFHTFNALVDQNKQIVLSADQAPSDIRGIEDRISSRMQSGLVVDLHPTNYELRLGILQQKLDLQRPHFPGIVVAEGVLEFLAHRISSNVRVLEGALMRLFAFGSLVGREVTLEVAQESLADLIRQSDRKITVEEIQRKVSDHYNIRLSDMIGPKRLRCYARPRQVAMYLAKQLTTRSLPDIGRRFGGRDHTTVMHGVRRIEELRGQDSQIAEDIELLRRALEA